LVVDPKVREALRHANLRVAQQERESQVDQRVEGRHPEGRCESRDMLAHDCHTTALVDRGLEEVH